MGKKPLAVSCAVGSHFAGGKVNGAHGCSVIPIPCLGSLCLLFVFTQGKKKEKKKWVHKLRMGLFVLLPVATYSSDTALTVLEINQEEREDSKGLRGNKAPRVNRGVWRPQSRQSLLVFPSRVGQHPLVGSPPWPALCKHPLKTHMPRGDEDVQPFHPVAT